MCGIAGLLDSSATTPAEELVMTATRMASALVHRGPDDAGSWADPASGIGLGFRRLAIIDLSSSGHQPMTSSDGRYVLVFNGELYNYRALRSELEQNGVTFHGTSDTEVLLEAIAAWGPTCALERADAMFALACWDRIGRSLVLARDRFGEKPLYYGWSGGTLLFGSELGALGRYPGPRAEIDRDALALFLRFGYVPAPRSIFQGIAKLLPGTWLRVDPGKAGQDLEPVPFWSAAEAAAEARSRPIQREEAGAAVEDALRRSVASRMVADVPVGAFLSGGLDSSLVVSLMQTQSSMPVRTFTIGFHESDYDEAKRAAAIARHLGTNHTELYVTPAEAQAVIPKLPRIYDEPFGDSSQIPVALVSELARREVTVALSGDGGDELFGGYTRYLAFERLRRVASAPRWLRHSAATLLATQSRSRWDRVAALVGRALPDGVVPSRAGEKIHKLARVLEVEAPEMLYAAMVTGWADPVVHGGSVLPTVIDLPATWSGIRPGLEWAMLADTLTYLPDDLLTKVDRATMAVSLEARVPMLSPDLFEVAWRLPRAAKVHTGRGKRVVAEVLRRHLPRELIDGPKVGFGVPVGDWLRGPLRGWAEDLLSPRRLEGEGYLEPEPVRRRWQEHRDGLRDHQYDLWHVLMFEAWLETHSAR